LFKKNIISFAPLNTTDMGPERSAKFYPSWFKELPQQLGPRHHERSIKACVPFKEAMSAGYTIPLWCDVNVHVARANDDKLKASFEWNEKYSVVELGGGAPVLDFHPPQQLGGSACPYSTNHENGIPKLTSPWCITTPKGWSCLFKNYSGEIHSKFRILEGIVDTDKYYGNVNFPFIWTGEKEGTFELSRGFPLIQVIPFKREELKLQVERLDMDKRLLVQNKLTSVLRDGYKRFFWHKGKG